MKISQMIKELNVIYDRLGDIEFKSVVQGEIVERNTKQCFTTENLCVVAIAKDFCPPDLVATFNSLGASKQSLCVHQIFLKEQNDQCSGRIGQCSQSPTRREH